ncbi:helix-turn-helix domain-containing protein [Thalassotalea psychrophila]|uniref:Helix-turn-helix domain-containing protein n=1 Tax=Thalassotalea psychrophila TaxID=3065647 RepID=A0ABY9TYV7_9GAMM|nr:helix-turn-helix domain-containing protein [Colwelliaceae bacterium SQ149]
MCKVGILLYDGCYASSFTGLIDSFQIANAIIEKISPGTSKITCLTISETSKPVSTHTGISIQPDYTFLDTPDIDILYIPACFYSSYHKTDEVFFEWLAKQQNVCNWLTLQYNSGVIMAANCTGTFLLAETGLLNWKAATTTWWLEKEFRHRYPSVRLDIKDMITSDERVICAGALSSYFNLAIKFIEQYSDPKIANLCAKIMLVDVGQASQEPYQTLFAIPEVKDELVSKVLYELQTNFQHNIDLHQLACKYGVSQRTLIRRFKSELDSAPLEYLQNVRLESAKKLLESSSLSLIQIVEQVGYSDVSSFSRLFKRRLGLTPVMYRNRFKQA